jgi:hypothetical protein
VAAVLDRAADLIEERGWIQGRCKDETGICALHAIDLATPDDDDDEMYWHTSEAVWQRVGWNITGWNDAPGRTAAEVIAALRAAAESERAT